jgi:hypothetical protein
MPESDSIERVTEALAQVLCGDSSSLLTVANLARGLQAPDQSVLAFSPAEGFAYYALHPLDFSQLPRPILADSRPAAVIGIRSIGTTLSAIVTAALRQRSRPAERITVRPTGHPYERVTRFSREQNAWIERHNSGGADFIDEDEGPGRSGSSFLSVGEALVEAGIEASRIIFLGSREIDPTQLCATNAVSRWNSFRLVVPRSQAYGRFSQDTYVGGGLWKRALPGGSTRDIDCWPQMERLKFLSRDQRWLFKFEGFGRFGQEILHRAGMVAEAGFGTAAEEVGDGMVRYPFITGTALRAGEVTGELLDRMAEYSAFRLAELGVRESPSTQLPGMVRFNLEQEFGVEINLDEQLQSERQVLVDGRMQPHEWIRSDTGELLKVDAYSHGDDHFFPGPTDIAWDLAGAIVEWNLEPDACDRLLSRFQQLSGDNARRRIPGFLVAYSVFRQSYCQMALNTVSEWEEQVSLNRASAYYRGWTKAHIQQNKNNSPGGKGFSKNAEEQRPILSLSASRMHSACVAGDDNP